MSAVRWHDLVAGVLAVGLLAGIVALAALGRDRPPEMTTAFAVAVGWVFGSGVQRANGALADPQGPRIKALEEEVARLLSTTVGERSPDA